MRFGPAASAVLGREAVRELDRRTIAAGVPSLGLMEKAGAALADFVEEVAEASPAGTTAGTTRRLLVLAGAGNNGGDGFVVARLLASRRWRCTVALLHGEPRAGGDAATNLAEWKRIGGRVIDRAAALELLDAGGGFDAVLDAMFGTGLDRPLADLDQHLIRVLNESGLPVVSADVPSGLCADRGLPLGAAVKARATLALGAAKPGLFLAEGPNHAGRVRVGDIGLLEPAAAGIHVRGWVLDRATTTGTLPPLEPMAHKGTRGHVLVVAGSRGKTGAAVLAARGALRAGAGLVTVAGVEEVQAAVAAALPEAMTLRLPADAAGAAAPGDALDRAIAGALDAADAVVLGPGLGRGPGAARLLDLVTAGDHARVLDADALQLLADSAEARQRLSQAKGTTVLTPHPGEMSRLTGTPIPDLQAVRDVAASNLAFDLGCVVVLKGAGTVVAARGHAPTFNTTGNPGMGAGGMGDVLAGAIGALLARMGDPFASACLAVHAHGAAGDRLEVEPGCGFLASELADALPAALATGHAR